MSKHTIHLPLTHTAEDPDELAIKYRVFREPEEADDHPVEMRALWIIDEGAVADVEEVDAFTFVLKPDTDHHARVAIAAYAESVRPFKPNLADDLMGVLSLGEWDRENGGEG